MSENTIEIVIGEKSFKLRVSEDQRELILKAVDEINSKMTEYSHNYQMIDKYDLLAMSALQLVTLKISAENTLNENKKELLNKVHELNKLLDLT